jgi:hypothetical protein
MLKVVHRLMLLILAFAFVGGTTVQFARSAQLAPIAVAGMPCDMAMSAAGMDRDKPMMPCKGMTPDCIKQMGCVTDVAVPACRVSIEPAVQSTAAVNYWSGTSGLTGFISSPEPLPPRTV